jgi:hypothetical protein
MRLLATLITMAASQLALAQTAYDPAIAYSTPEKSGEALYVANADGSRAVRLVSNKGNFRGIDLAPGGRRIAYIDAAGLKVLDFTASNSGVTLGATRLLVPAGTGFGPGLPDFSQDGTALLFEYSSTEVKSMRAIRVADGTLLFNYPCRFCEHGRWLRNELGVAIAYAAYTMTSPNIRQVWMAVQAGDGSFTPLLMADSATQGFNEINDLDVARTRNSLLLSAYFNTGPRMLELDLATGAITDRGACEKAGFTSDDLHIVCVSPHVKAGDYIRSIEVTTGFVTNISTRGTWGRLDARP